MDPLAFEPKGSTTSFLGSVAMLRNALQLGKRQNAFVSYLTGDLCVQLRFTCNPENRILSYGVQEIVKHACDIVYGRHYEGPFTNLIRDEAPAIGSILWSIIAKAAPLQTRFAEMAANLCKLHDPLTAKTYLVCLSDFLYNSRDETPVYKFFKDDPKSIFNPEFREKLRIEAEHTCFANSNVLLASVLGNDYMDRVERMFRSSTKRTRSATGRPSGTRAGLRQRAASTSMSQPQEPVLASVLPLDHYGYDENFKLIAPHPVSAMPTNHSSTATSTALSATATSTAPRTSTLYGDLTFDEYRNRPDVMTASRLQAILTIAPSATQLARGIGGPGLGHTSDLKSRPVGKSIAFVRETSGPAPATDASTMSVDPP